MKSYEGIKISLLTVTTIFLSLQLSAQNSYQTRSLAQSSGWFNKTTNLEKKQNKANEDRAAKSVKQLFKAVSKNKKVKIGYKLYLSALSNEKRSRLPESVDKIRAEQIIALKNIGESCTMIHDCESIQRKTTRNKYTSNDNSKTPEIVYGNTRTKLGKTSELEVLKTQLLNRSKSFGRKYKYYGSEGSLYSLYKGNKVSENIDSDIDTFLAAINNKISSGSFNQCSDLISKAIPENSASRVIINNRGC